MSGDVDFTKGGYGGDDYEERFKYFTAEHMEYWWQFREVLIASHLESANWVDKQGYQLGDDAQRILVALSMTNYAVYTGIAEALTFFNELRYVISQRNLFDARRNWKAAYSSAYTSFVAICNIICVVLDYEKTLKKPPKNEGKKRRNYSLGNALELVDNRYPELKTLIEQCNKRLEIRHHLDHYWTIWTHFDFQQGRFYMITDFAKGKVILRAEEVKATTDIPMRTYRDIVQMAEDYNAIYKILALKGAYLDKFLESRGWVMKYGDGKRPLTKADIP